MKSKSRIILFIYALNDLELIHDDNNAICWTCGEEEYYNEICHYCQSHIEQTY